MANQFNILLDEPPEFCEVNGREYKVNTDFRVVLAYMRLMDGEDSEEDKAIYGMALFFGDMIAVGDLKGLSDWLRWYIKRGVERQEEERKETPIFDIMMDSGRVYTAFLQTYKINLRKSKMHWWVFGELLEGLPKGTHLADVIELRGRKFETWMKAGDRNELQRAKNRYRIGAKTNPIVGLFDYLKGIS
jgi:hypothetical protein